MREDIIRDITEIKKRLYKVKNTNEMYKLYNQLYNLIDVYKDGCIKNNKNRINFKEHNKILSHYKDVVGKISDTKLTAISEQFKKDKNKYYNYFNELIDDLNIYFGNNKYIKNNKDKVNFDAIEKLFLKFDKDFYKFYLGVKDHITIADDDVDLVQYMFEGYSFYSDDLDKSYAISINNIYTYAHELAHMYQSDCIKKNNRDFDTTNLSIEIYPLSVELIVGYIKNKNRTCKIRILESLREFLFLFQYLFDEKTEDVASIYECAINLVGVIGGLNLYFKYLEDKSLYFESIDILNKNIDFITSIKDINSVIGGKKNIELIKKFIRE